MAQSLTSPSWLLGRGGQYRAKHCGPSSALVWCHNLLRRLPGHGHTVYLGNVSNERGMLGNRERNGITLFACCEDYRPFWLNWIHENTENIPQKFPINCCHWQGNSRFTCDCKVGKGTRSNAFCLQNNKMGTSGWFCQNFDQESFLTDDKLAKTNLPHSFFRRIYQRKPWKRKQFLQLNQSAGYFSTSCTRW